jgi:hypothetical protein
VEIVLFIPVVVFFSVLAVIATYRQIKLWSLTNQINPIPVYDKPEFKLYEVGILIDGKLHDRDFVAAIAEIILHPEMSLDLLQEGIKAKMTTKQVLDSILVSLSNSKYGDLSQDHTKRLYENKVYSEMVRSGYFAYNPLIIRLVAVLLIVLFLAIDLAFFASNLIISDWQILSMGLLGTVALFSHSFHLNINKVVKARSLLLGYRMFLKTTEFYKVQLDNDAYRKHIPMLIALGVHTDQWPRLLEYLSSLVSDR